MKAKRKDTKVQAEKEEAIEALKKSIDQLNQLEAEAARLRLNLDEIFAKK